MALLRALRDHLQPPRALPKSRTAQRRTLHCRSHTADLMALVAAYGGGSVGCLPLMWRVALRRPRRDATGRCAASSR